MVDVMSVHEYATAVTSLRQAQSELITAELTATRQALARARTVQGRVEQKRRANTAAARLLRTAVEAERIAKLEALKSASLEPEELGRERLIAATAELFKIPPEQVIHHRDHGLRAYLSGRCKCDEICRPANAKRNRDQRAKTKAQA